MPLRGLLAQHLDPGTDLTQDVDDAHELRLRGPQARQRVLATLVQTPDPRRLLDDEAPVRRPEREDLVDHALADERERVVREVGAGKQLHDVAQPYARAVDEVFALAAAVDAAADLDL